VTVVSIKTLFSIICVYGQRSTTKKPSTWQLAYRLRFKLEASCIQAVLTASITMYVSTLMVWMGFSWLGMGSDFSLLSFWYWPIAGETWKSSWQWLQRCDCWKQVIMKQLRCTSTCRYCSLNPCQWKVIFW